MASSVQYSKGVLVFLICQVWLPSFASSQSSTATATSPMSMATSSVSMSTDSPPTTNVMMTSSMAASSSSSSMPMASTSTAATTTASMASSTAMSASTSMASTSTASAMTTDSTSMSSMSTSYPGSSTMMPPNSTISCRSFNCDSNCKWMFMNMSSSPCPSNSNYCELRKLNDSMYSVGCVDSCDLNSNGCANDSQISCVKDCCNTTDCLNSTIQSMDRTTETTVAPATTPVVMTTMQPTNQPTQQNNGMKCKMMTCTGADCYKNTDAPMMWCYGQNNYCALKKSTDGSVISWMAGCTSDCTQGTACTSSTDTCYQECCEASAMGDCLKLDGTVAMPNSEANRAIFSPLMLLVTTLMAWLVMGDQL
ncbi:serine-rich adhesin for platelets [Sardina pilchardus]|uniref:serine-rich adhesin for platelets n=1 Tax=Sardina pilchardus TaxID=27697 RepID=UPI002E0D14B0